MAGIPLGFSDREQEAEYTRAANVNVSNFVSVKLSGHDNYKIWEAQMRFLMDSLNMLDLVENRSNKPSSPEREYITKKYNDLLKGWIFGSLSEQVAKVFVYGSQEEDAQSLWREITDTYGRTTGESMETIAPEYEDTELKEKLRNVALEGWWRKAKSILMENPRDVATVAINSDGDTMLHLAIREGNNYFLQKLVNFLGPKGLIENTNFHGQTSLHIAASVGNIDAARFLVNKSTSLLQIKDHESSVPLLSASLNKQLNTFEFLLEATKTELERYPIPFHLYNTLIIDLIHRKQFGLALKLHSMYDKKKIPIFEVFMALTRGFPIKMGFWEELAYPSLTNFRRKIVKRSSLVFHSLEFVSARAEQTLWAMKEFKDKSIFEIVMILLAPLTILYPFYQLIRLLILVLLFPFFMLYFLLWKVLAFVVVPINRIEKKRRDHREAKELLRNLFNMFYHWLSNDRYTIMILEAVRLDVYEVAHQILLRSPKIIIERNHNEEHNVFQLAIINRSEKVYNLLCPIIEHTRSYRQMKDSFNNNLLHLAGRLAPSFVLSRTTGAAMQLQRELQFHKLQEVEKIMEPRQLKETNVENWTPEMVFTREHADLVKQGEQWMKTTAESCSISAALIVTIVFAAAITVPGGSNQETGIPMFNKDIAFTIFAVSDALSLFTAATSLLVFLSILTIRFSEKDFLLNLPRRMIIGLFFLILSTTAMMVAFSAILFLVFCDQKAWMLAPIGGLACLPIAAVVTLQLPLVDELIQSTYFPMFGRV